MVLNTRRIRICNILPVTSFLQKVLTHLFIRSAKVFERTVWSAQRGLRIWLEIRRKIFQQTSNHSNIIIRAINYHLNEKSWFFEVPKLHLLLNLTLYILMVVVILHIRVSTWYLIIMIYWLENFEWLNVFCRQQSACVLYNFSKSFCIVVMDRS